MTAANSAIPVGDALIDAIAQKTNLAPDIVRAAEYNEEKLTDVFRAAVASENGADRTFKHGLIGAGVAVAGIICLSAGMSNIDLYGAQYIAAAVMYTGGLYKMLSSVTKQSHVRNEFNQKSETLKTQAESNMLKAYKAGNKPAP
jgi:hypothetical protein